jgi:hypothetical protein
VLPRARAGGYPTSGSRRGPAVHGARRPREGSHGGRHETVAAVVIGSIGAWRERRGSNARRRDRLETRTGRCDDAGGASFCILRVPRGVRKRSTSCLSVVRPFASSVSDRPERGVGWERCRRPAPGKRAP